MTMRVFRCGRRKRGATIAMIAAAGIVVCGAGSWAAEDSDSEPVHHLKEVWGTCSVPPPYVNGGIFSIAVGPFGDIFAFVFNGHKIRRFASDGEFLGDWPCWIPLDPDAADLAVDSENAIWMTDGDASVFKYAADGTLLQRLGRTDRHFGSAAGEFHGPSGIAIAADGTICVADAWNFRIQLFNPDGTFLRQWTRSEWGSQVSQPWKIAATPSNVVVVDTDRRVSRFSFEGALLSEHVLETPVEMNDILEIRGICSDAGGRISILGFGNRADGSIPGGFVIDESASGDFLRSWFPDEHLIETSCQSFDFDVDDEGFVYTASASAIKKFWYEGIAIRTTDSLARLTVDGVPMEGLGVYRWEPGSTHVVTGDATQFPDGGAKLDFHEWEHGGSLSQTFVAPVSPATFTADFDRSYLLTNEAGHGGIVTPESGWFAEGESVRLDVIPSSGFNFYEWVGTGDGSYNGRFCPVYVEMQGPLHQAATFHSHRFDFAISASATDPSVAVAAPPNGIRELHFWLTCADAYLSAFEADPDPWGALQVLAFQPADGVWNLGTDGKLFLAVSGCSDGPELPLRLGSWIVNDFGGGLCLKPSAASGWIGAVDCGFPEPQLWTSPLVHGFSSDGAPPCTTGTWGCIDPTTPNQILDFVASPVPSGLRVSWRLGEGTFFESMTLERIKKFPPITGVPPVVIAPPFSGPGPFAFVDRNLDFGLYFYRITATDGLGGTRTFSTGDVLYEPMERAERVVADSIRPNPFREKMEITLASDAGEGRASAIVYDVTGRRVRTLLDSAVEGGATRLTWTGDDDEGRFVPAGVYFLRYESGGVTKTHKVVYLGLK